jgi:hypothetical protein
MTSRHSYNPDLSAISDAQLDSFTQNVIEEMRRRYSSLDEIMVDQFLLSMKHGLVQIQCIREQAREGTK